MKPKQFIKTTALIFIIPCSSFIDTVDNQNFKSKVLYIFLHWFAHFNKKQIKGQDFVLFPLVTPVDEDAATAAQT